MFDGDEHTVLAGLLCEPFLDNPAMSVFDTREKFGATQAFVTPADSLEQLVLVVGEDKHLLPSARGADIELFPRGRAV